MSLPKSSEPEAGEDDLQLGLHFSVWLLLGIYLIFWSVLSARYGIDETSISQVSDVVGTNAPALWNGKWWRLLASLGVLPDIFDLAIAGLTLCLAGRWLEERLGGLRLLLVYVVAGLTGSLTCVVMENDAGLAAPCGLAGLMAVAVVGVAMGPAPRSRFDRVALGSALSGLLWQCLSAPLEGVVAGILAGLIIHLLLGSRCMAERPWQWAGLTIALVLWSLLAVRVLRPHVERAAQYQYDLGVAAWHDGNARQAIRRWERAVANDTDFAPAHVSLSLGYERKGLLRAAARELDVARVLAPSNTAVLARLGEQASKEGQPQLAEAYWRMLLALRPHETEGTLALAAAQASEGNVRAAARLYDDLYRRLPSDHRVAFEAASFYTEDGNDVALAQKLFARLATATPTSARDAVYVTAALLESGQAAEAERMASRFIRLAAASSGAPARSNTEAAGSTTSLEETSASDEATQVEAQLRMLRANARAELGRFADAIADVDARALLGTSTWSEQYDRARIYAWWSRDLVLGHAAVGPPSGHMTAAWDDALNAATTSFERNLTAGFRELSVSGDAHAAIEYARAAVQEKPYDAEALYLLGLALRSAGREGEAVPLLREAAAHEPGDREFSQALSSPRSIPDP